MPRPRKQCPRCSGEMAHGSAMCAGCWKKAAKAEKPVEGQRDFAERWGTERPGEFKLTA